MAYLAKCYSMRTIKVRIRLGDYGDTSEYGLGKATFILVFHICTITELSGIMTAGLDMNNCVSGVYRQALCMCLLMCALCWPSVFVCVC